MVVHEVPSRVVPNDFPMIENLEMNHDLNRMKMNLHNHVEIFQNFLRSAVATIRIWARVDLRKTEGRGDALDLNSRGILRIMRQEVNQEADFLVRIEYKKLILIDAEIMNRVRRVSIIQRSNFLRRMNEEDIGVVQVLEDRDSEENLISEENLEVDLVLEVDLILEANLEEDPEVDQVSEEDQAPEVVKVSEEALAFEAIPMIPAKALALIVCNLCEKHLVLVLKIALRITILTTFPERPELMEGNTSRINAILVKNFLNSPKNFRMKKMMKAKY